MRRRSRAASGPVKTRGRKTAKLKPRDAPKVASRRSSAGSQDAEVARLTREVTEALEQQTATSEVLNVISSSPGELEPVFQAILANATRICGANFGQMNLYAEGSFRPVAFYNAPAAYAASLGHTPFQPHPQSGLGTVTRTHQVVHIEDIRTLPPYLEGNPSVVAIADLAGARTYFVVPMLREHELIGAITIYRQEVKPFTVNQIELVANFAKQAVIAIENTRLLNELRESLQQQTATADVLKVISRSTFDLQTVLQTLVESAARLCEADKATITRQKGEVFYRAEAYGFSAEFLDYVRSFPIVPERGSAHGRVLLEGKVVHIADVLADPEYTFVEAQRLGDFRTVLGVPMLREGIPIGAMALTRSEVRPFTDKQIELVSTFADQAVIAIENVRLFEAEQQRTRELTESLDQQTATSEVLQVISSSPDDLQPVFASMLEKAVRICDAKFGTLYLHEAGGLRLMAAHDVPQGFSEARRDGLTQPAPGGALEGATRTKRTVQITDLAATQAYTERHLRMVEAVEIGGIRTIVAVPMLKDNELVGVIAIHRREVLPFTEKQIELVTNFAAQAVIAIENARLLNELRQRTTDLTEALEQQTATSDVLQVISSSPGDLQPVFATILEKAARICDAKFGNIFRWDGEALHLVATYNTPPAFFEFRSGSPLSPNPENPIGRLIATKAAVHIADLAAEKLYVERHDANVIAAVELGGIRTFVAVPMLKENELIGAVIVYRQEVRSFTDTQIALVTSFASQAVIAIENTRLLNELRQRTTDLTERTNDLTEALEQQTATSEVLKVISSSPAALEPVFRAMLENATRLCGANFGVLVLREGDAFRVGATHNVPPAFAELRQREPAFRPGPLNPVARVAATKELLHISNLAEDAAYKEHDPAAVIFVELAGTRSLLVLPMLKENEISGAIAISRSEVRPFTDKQIALVQNFAAQAVIAIENTRLLNELRERTNQLEVQSKEVVKLNQQLEQRVADQVGEIERMGRLRRFLPPQVADLIVASGSEKQLDSHRREITALFCDLRGFTGFSETSDPEDVMALLRDYHAAIGEIIIKYSGTLERYAGDGVMVVFNDPVPVEKPALQAVLMALEMRDVIGALTEKWRRLGHDIGFGIGISHGFATLGTIGFEGRFDYAAIGTVSNVASRLCDEAKPGQILISPRVFMAVEDAVTVEPIGEFALKGIRRPISAYNVLAAASPTA